MDSREICCVHSCPCGLIECRQHHQPAAMHDTHPSEHQLLTAGLMNAGIEMCHKMQATSPSINSHKMNYLLNGLLPAKNGRYAHRAKTRVAKEEFGLTAVSVRILAPPLAS